MYRFIILFSYLVLVMPVFASQTVITQHPYNNYSRNIYPNFYQNQAYRQNYYPNENYTINIFNDINSLEEYAFNRVYNNESKLNRLERLEELAFGSIQQGDIYARYQNVKNAILSHSNGNNKTSFLKNLQNYFTGQLTGYTPQLSTPYYYPQTNYNNGYNLPPQFSNNSFINFAGPQGRGYRYNNSTNGSTSGVHILD